MMRILLIDDEKPARDLVVSYLQDQQDIEIKEATNGFEGVKLLSTFSFDLVLLDIQMPKLNGFEMLELVENPPNIIFCTAYDEYAIKAFEQNAVDYLLKPFSKQRLLSAIKKVRGQSVVNVTSVIKDELRLEPLNRIVVKNGKTIDIIPTKEIRYLQSQDDYVEIHTHQKKYLKQERIKYYESVLDKNLFVRVHRQFILNISFIHKLEKFGKESYIAQLKDGDAVSISASGYLRLKEVLEM